MEMFWHDVKTEAAALRAMSGWTIRITDIHGRHFDARVHDARVASTLGCELLYSPLDTVVETQPPPELRMIDTDEIARLEIY